MYLVLDLIMHQNDTNQPVTKVKLIVGTTNSHALISVPIKQATDLEVKEPGLSGLRHCMYHTLPESHDQ